MKNVTNEYRRGVLDNREFLYEAKITFADGNMLTLNDKTDLMGDGISITSGTSGTDSFDIGAAVMGELVMNLNNSTEKFDAYNFLDAQISLKIGLQLENRAEFLQMGTYTVEEANTAGVTITLSALDKMSWFEKKYSEVQTVYPKTLYWIVKDICDQCGVGLSGNFPGGSTEIKKRPEDGEMSCIEMISYAAQVAGCYAIIDGGGSLSFRWYDRAVFEEIEYLDGGRLKPIDTDGFADGGDFHNYGAGARVDGGDFYEQRKYAHIFAMASMEVATDEILITGIRVKAEEEPELQEEESTEEEEGEPEGYLYGKEGYILSISENPLISKDMEQSVAERLGEKTVGMKIRKFSVKALGNPAIEAGDCAYISDWKGNSYPAYITNIAFKLGNYEDFSCGAQSPARNRRTGITANTQVNTQTKNEIKKQLTAHDTAVKQLTELMANSFGVYKTEEIQADGSVIYYMHDKPELSESKIIWKMVSGAVAVSADGGKSWNAGLTAEGNMVLSVLSSVGINADWINAGEISSATINIGNNTFLVDAGGNVKITKGIMNIGDGAFMVDTNGNMVSTNASIQGTIVGRNGYSLEYYDTSTRPQTLKRYVFAETGGKDSGDPYLTIKSPNGTVVFTIEGPANRIPSGNKITADGTIVRAEDMPVFPNGALIQHAYLESLEYFSTKYEVPNLEDVTLILETRVSGAFICVSGDYTVKKHDTGEVKEFSLGYFIQFPLPSQSSVETTSRRGKRLFVFDLTTGGILKITNMGTGIDVEEPVKISFRFDYVNF